MQKKLSLIIAALDSFEEIKDLLQYVEKQTMSDSLETIVICKTRELLAVPNGALNNVPGLQIVEGGENILLHEARALGVRSAQTDYVAILEDHCFPAPTWAEHTLARIEEGWAAVGPAMELANPQTALAQGTILMAYGQWLRPISSGETEYVPGHNSAFDCKLLLQRGQALDFDMLANSLMQEAWRADGHHFYLEPKAVMHHWESSQWPGMQRAYYAVGRALGACRSKNWSIWKRILFGFASPLIAAVRWSRAVRAYRRTHKANGFSVLALLCAVWVSVVWSYGELLGFWFGFGNSLKDTSDVERNRARYLQAGEWPKPATMPAG